MSDSNKHRIARWAEELWSQGRLEVVDDLYADRYLYQGQERTVASFKAGIAAWRTALPDLRVTLGAVIEEVDMVVWEWTFHGTFVGPLRGEQPTGDHISLSGVHIGRFAGGVIVEEREYFDEQELLTQLRRGPESAA